MKTYRTAILTVILMASIAGEAFAAGALPDTGQTAVYVTGDDGYYKSGAQQSYTDNLNGTITDNWTGLMWIKDSNTQGVIYTSWDGAINICENLNYANRSDWRLPNIKELLSIVDRRYDPSINPAYFLGVQYFRGYWTSTTYVPDTTKAWVVGFGISSYVGGSGKTNAEGCFRCVRGGL